jgi:hypothetical protein
MRNNILATQKTNLKLRQPHLPIYLYLYVALFNEITVTIRVHN